VLGLKVVRFIVEIPTAHCDSLKVLFVTVHAAIMAVQSFQNASERGHLFGDVPALIIVGVALLALLPEKKSAERASAARA